MSDKILMVSAVSASAVVNGTIPIWRPYLAALSEIAGLLGPIVALISAVYVLVMVYRSRDRRATTSELTEVATRTRSPGLWIGVAIAAVLAWLTVRPANAHAAHSEPVTVTNGRSKRKQPADAAGDDGDVADYAPAGAPPWYTCAHGYVGVSERLSNGASNPAVERWLALVNYPNADARKVAWCAAFVAAALAEARQPHTRSASARSYLRWGKPLDGPRTGCVVVLWRGKHDDGVTGHVGFLQRCDGDYVYVLGGNQGDAVSVARFSRSRVLSYRWPTNAATAPVNVGAVTAGVSGAGVAAVAVVDAASHLAETPTPVVSVTLPPVPTSPSQAIEATERAAQIIAGIKSPIQDVATTAAGSPLAKYLTIALAVLTVAGAALAIYGQITNNRKG